MAESCREQQVKVEENVLQPVDKWVKQQENRCKNEKCKWWMLCLNKLVCWLVWVTVKVTEWVLIVVVRWVYRIVCVTVSLLVGLVALITGHPDIFVEAIKDLAELVEDALFFALGAVLLYANDAIEAVLTVLGVKDPSRPLTDNEIGILRPIYGDALAYDLIRISEGRLGIMGPPFATVAGGTTIGYNIYFRFGTINSTTLVHESVHVWQFQFGGTQYIGQSAVLQVFTGPSIYNWWTMIGVDDEAWYQLKSIEAQAQFVQDLYTFGTFNFTGGAIDNSNGAFFQVGKGQNQFIFQSVDFTDRANAAWTILKTG